MQVITIGLDLGKRVFQVHGVDAAGKVAIRRKLQRSEMAGFFLPICLPAWSALKHVRPRTIGLA